MHLLYILQSRGLCGHWSGERCCRGKGVTLFSEVLFSCTRGRSVEADQGGRHSDLWTSRRYKTLQCAEGTVGLLSIRSHRAIRQRPSTSIVKGMSSFLSAGAVGRVVRPRLTIYVCQESQQPREQQPKHENGDAAANTFFGQCTLTAPRQNVKHRNNCAVIASSFFILSFPTVMRV